MFNKKSEIVFIGAGKVAHTLVPLMVKKNYNIKGIISRHKDTFSSLVRKFKPDYYSTSLNKIPIRHGIFFITVPDDQISIVAGKLASLNLDFRVSLFIHTSGSESSKALNVLERKGALTASFHIMQTFPSLKQTDIRNSYAAVETKSTTAERFLFPLARALNLKPIKLTGEAKVFYHMAGVFTANFLNANFSASEKLLDKAGLGNKQHYRMFEPIIKTTLSNIKNEGVPESLSGPVQRGDCHTVQRHIAALNKLKQGEKELILHSYISQSLILLEIIKEKGRKLTVRQKEMKKMLEAELKKV